MFWNNEGAGAPGPTSVMPSGWGELPAQAQRREQRRLEAMEAAAIVALLIALALEAGLALGLY
ncbi:hypothetical protein CKO44_04115 [Rubrivivax gelatinosus]|uniref:Uncharacterized protein n=1 Tax=Rubrivivax gelatinosus TaxID=28068 RepID=A0ABS1DQV1_RUBGE|nr:hypothetical protein [Rubrivivax gelatinosus]MBK1612650.1 hypothetical protein [Rubrivivax gelatinosus]MBK1712372.1 hypothetical protein [Rubrivivax gelatinosus]MBZ8144228.1 hypothetical protein [Rubrivivax gelatinosus]